MSTAIVTRFAPSPTGALHLGNARTALFSWLAARAAAGRFVLRLEDTDAARSTAAHAAQLEDDLRWLGLDWDAGPDREDAAGPYRQSARGDIYAGHFARLEAQGLTYPCYCTDTELEVSRRVQLAQGRAPRYAGTCRDLTPEQRAERIASGRVPAWRFRMPAAGVIAFDDRVRGPQQFPAADIGDFIVRRGDGTPAFFFCNAVDDSLMGVTLVLRGDDHLSNTPRQLAILQALDLRAPAYGHLPLLLGADGAPLSKRTGSASVADLRAEGYLPGAVLNQLLRLGHSGAPDGWVEPAELPRHFHLERVGRAPAHFDTVQLDHWQREAVRHASVDDLLPWVRQRVPPGRAEALVTALRANWLKPADAAHWAHVVHGELPCAPADIAARLAAAGTPYFDAALAAASEPITLPALVAAIRGATGVKGKALYEPLRLALTHQADGPELATLLEVMPAATVRARLDAARRATMAAH